MGFCVALGPTPGRARFKRFGQQISQQGTEGTMDESDPMSIHMLHCKSLNFTYQRLDWRIQCIGLTANMSLSVQKCACLQCCPVYVYYQPVSVVPDPAPCSSDLDNVHVVQQIPLGVEFSWVLRLYLAQLTFSSRCILRRYS